MTMSDGTMSDGTMSDGTPHDGRTSAGPPSGETPSRPGRFAYEGLDRVMHEKARLGVLTSLIAHPKGLAFADLKRLCGLTDGNLSRHLQVLAEAGLVEILKGYEHNRPQTMCRITADGRRRFLDYLAVLEQVVRDAADAAERATAERVAGGRDAAGRESGPVRSGLADDPAPA